MAEKPTSDGGGTQPSASKSPAPPVAGDFDFDRHKARRENANRKRLEFQPLLDEAFKYAIPFRKGLRESGQGEKRVNQVFDHTAIDSAFRFAGKLQQDLWPAGSENFQLEPGPLVQDAGQREQFTKYLANTTQILQAFYDDGAFDMALHECALELSAGNCCFLLNPTAADDDRLWDPISVPIDEVTWELGPSNTIAAYFWPAKMTVRVLFATWPEGKFSARLEKLLNDTPEAELEVHRDVCYDPAKKRWVQYVTVTKDDGLIWTASSRTSPFVGVRYFRVPGETYGRGPVMLAMPTIKTLNTAKRLQLQAAAIAMLGIYTAIDDGVFNPDNSPLEPGTFWKVGRNGGPLGPTISRFPDPRLDLSGLVVENMQVDVKATMMDQALPVEGAAVKSATEILERVKRLAQDHIGAYGRLVRELVVPIVRRNIELAYDKQLLPNDIPIDQLLVKVKVKSPLALARESQRVSRIVEWLQMVLAICAGVGQPGMAAYVAKIEAALRDIGRQMGVPEALIVDTALAAQLKKADQDHQLAMAAAAAGGKALQGATGA